MTFHFQSSFQTIVNRFSDMICMASNDDLLHTVSKQRELGRKDKSRSVGLDELNEYVAQGLAGLLLPIHSTKPSLNDRSKLSIG